ncbi:hypothetical protein Esti_003536 [Eimeria stiedai]
MGSLRRGALPPVLLLCLCASLQENLNTSSAAAAAAGGKAPTGAPDGGRARVSVVGEDEEDSEFEDGPLDLPVPNAFAPRPSPSPPAAAPPPQPKPNTNTSGQPLVEQALVEAATFLLAYKVIDCLALLLLVVVMLVAVNGKRKNTQIATQWTHAIREVLQVQFAAVAEGTKGALTARSYNSFDLFCSGRRHCVCMLASLDCLWRGHVLRRLLGFSGDLVTLEFILHEAGEGLILNLCKKQEQRACMEAAWDLMEFSKVRHASSVASQLPEGLSLMSDTQEAAERFLEIPGMQKHLQQLGPYLRCVYTSDLCTNTNPILRATIAAVFGSCAAAINKPKRVLRITYQLPEEGDDGFDPRLPIVVGCKLVDALATLRLSEAADHCLLGCIGSSLAAASPHFRKLQQQLSLHALLQSRESVKKLRLAYEREQQKQRRKEQQEAAEKRRIEKKREQEKAIESLPDEQRRKAQEAQEKKAVKEQRKEQRQGIRVVRA